MLTILVGESAAGKDFIQKHLEEGGYEPLVSTTTRPMREGEVEGKNYFFVDRETFEQGIKDDKFIEHRAYNTLVNGKPDTWYYGMRKMQLDPNKQYITVVDCDGAKGLMDYFGKNNCFVVYVFAEDLTRQARAQSRGSFDLTEWTRRLADDSIKFKDVRNIANYVAVNQLEDKDSVNDMLYYIQYAGRVFDAHKKQRDSRYVCNLYCSEDGEVQCLVTNESSYVKELEGRIQRLHGVAKSREE